MASSQQLPKAILYSWHTSVWGTVPRLCLHEKGYSPDEYIVKSVNLDKGENFSPSYLKINLNGTVPTLVVPMLETVGTEVDSRYRSLRDTISICDFLDNARGMHSSNTTSKRPAPALAPATIEGKATSDNIISLVHSPSVDPNFLFMAARSKAQLQEKAKGVAGDQLQERKVALATYLKEAKQSVAESPVAVDGNGGAQGQVQTYEQKIVQFLEDKSAANEMLWEVYNGRAGDEREKAYFSASEKCWTEGLPDVLAKLESAFKGVYALGDHVSLADLHVIAWLARIIHLAGGNLGTSGIDILDKEIGKKAVGPKVRAFWIAFGERQSFKKVYTESLH